MLPFDEESSCDIERRANVTLAYVQAWGIQNKLKFAPSKTNAVTFTKN